MKKLAWLTDIHLDSLPDDDSRRKFAREIHEKKPDVLLIGGDVGKAPSVCDYLRLIESELHISIYFVLGNHDYYVGSIKEVRDKVRELSQESENLCYLPAAGVIEVTVNVALIGHGGWADGRFGNFLESSVRLNDYVYIEDLSLLSPEERLQKLNMLGDEAAAFVRQLLPEALGRYAHVYFLTHVPPFRQAATYEGKPSDDNYAPHFACKAVGDALLEIMDNTPERKLTVLCGHTHGAGRTQILPNLEVVTGGAEYGSPAVQEIFEIE